MFERQQDKILIRLVFSAYFFKFARLIQTIVNRYRAILIKSLDVSYSYFD